MRKNARLILCLVLVAGIAGLLLVVAASKDLLFPADVGDSWLTHAGDTTSTPLSVSDAVPHTGQGPEASPTRAPQAVPTAAPTTSQTAAPSPTPTPVAISPAFVSSTGAIAYVESGTLIVIEPNAFKVTAVAEGVDHGARALTWSPDGRWLRYASERDSASKRQAFQVWDSQGKETLQVEGDIPDFLSRVHDVQNAGWSPEGTRILFQLSSETPSREAWVLDVTTGSAWPLPDLAIQTAAWIDEDTILHDNGQGARFQLMSVGPPARALTRTVAVEGAYVLSPNRDRVAWFQGEPGKGQRLHVSPLSNQMPVSLSHQPTVMVSTGDPLWSPDGRWVAYGAEAIASDGETEPLTLLADTWGVAATQNVPGLLPVGWSADSRLLAGFGCIDATCSLSLIDVLSGQVTSLASGRHLRLWDLTWSPGGVYLLYSTSSSDVDTDVEGLTLWNRATGERLPLIPGSETRPLTDLQWTADGCALYAVQRKKEGTDLVPSVIWGVGPTWEDRWYVAPGFSESFPSLIETLRRREASQGASLCPGPLLDTRRLIAYYGTPQGPGLGILGRNDVTETLRLLKEQTQIYHDLDPDVNTIPAFHMVTTIADDFPGPDGDFNHRVSPETVRRWIESIEVEDGWSILDIQPGRAPLVDELDLIEPLLLEPHVHLAVDPEFVVREGQVPGHQLGQITGAQINWIQARLDHIARVVGERKLLIIHQFNDRMIEDKGMVLDYPLVDLVWDADGFGSPFSKVQDYDQYQMEAGFDYGAFKLFYEHDDPLITPEEVLSLDPSPRLVIYQ